ncbi:ABC transporter substrate-binding protein [Acidisphaera sp. L21]|uniref:ABC transporter substrate-binding protein n=1 Tax=Acidisphaera sp. L21 TaxID=1641851 RepID=UPI00131E4EC5|nr:ABC transporter substrate-binding protein [Acidisphaera sp. L21]
MVARLIACLLATSALASVAHAQAPAPIRITVIADLNDDLYNARAGNGGVDATRMAVADFGGSVLGRPIVVDALNDHNKAAEAPALATQAYDAGADLLMDIQNSPIAAAVSKIATTRHKLAITTGAANSTLTRAACSRYFYHYSFDLPSITTATARYLASQPGNKRWVIIAEDTGFGKGSASLMSPIVTAHGDQVVKSIVVPASTTDFSSVLDDVRSSQPNVVAVFSDGAKGDNGATDITKAGLKATVTTALLYLSDVDRVKDGYAGIVAAVPWYWNLDQAARAWANRFAADHNGLRPTAAQAADYSATTQWLTAVQTAGTTDADAVIHALDGHKFDDIFAHHGEFRASDHMVMHDLYIVRVRPSAQLPEPHAWYDVLDTVPAATAFPTSPDCQMP